MRACVCVNKHFTFIISVLAGTVFTEHVSQSLTVYLCFVVLQYSKLNLLADNQNRCW